MAEGSNMADEIDQALPCYQPVRVEIGPRDCINGYCLCNVQRNARRLCVERGEGWRYGLAHG